MMCAEYIRGWSVHWMAFLTTLGGYHDCLWQAEYMGGGGGGEIYRILCSEEHHNLTSPKVLSSMSLIGPSPPNEEKIGH